MTSDKLNELYLKAAQCAALATLLDRRLEGSTDFPEDVIAGAGLLSDLTGGLSDELSQQLNQSYQPAQEG